MTRGPVRLGDGDRDGLGRVDDDAADLQGFGEHGQVRRVALDDGGQFVYPQFRKQGVATALIRRVLDTLRTQGKTVTVVCPIVRTFITSHPEYEDLVDAGRPGLKHSRG